MSAYNTVEASTTCPHCGVAREFEVQFKFGDTWQHKYHCGEALLWGGNDVGERGHKAVVVEGIGGPCLNCGAEFLDFDVVVIDNRIIEVRPATTRDPPASGEGFAVLVR